jgi:hypothetical protein
LFVLVGVMLKLFAVELPIVPTLLKLTALACQKTPSYLLALWTVQLFPEASDEELPAVHPAACPLEASEH